MGEVWFTVGVPAAVAVATGIYTTGGRAALARRTIRQELEIANMLPAGDSRTAVERMAEEKAILYVSRWIGPQPLGLREHALLVGAAIVGALLTWLAVQIYDLAGRPAWLGPYLLVLMVSGLATITLALTLWVSLIIMGENAESRSATIAARRRRVGRHLASAHEDGNRQ